ncbi:MAG: RNA pseudouridine synthase, partial [Candidatus Marinimicrobia bacterium]|nr:RNA pseudouridine synthase [Candidatus Neomarinimicrobiota bacterium]
MITTLLVEKLQDVGLRLDHYLVYNLVKHSRSHIQSFIRSGHIRVNGKKVKTGYSLELEDLIQIEMPADESITKKLVPENLDLNIIYEDEWIIVINKPAGLIVHPGVGARNGTLAHGLTYHFKNLSDINGDFRPGIVHRLDKQTSGVMIVAKTNEAHSFLADQFKARKVKKKYIGLTWGHWKDEEGEI